MPLSKQFGILITMLKKTPLILSFGYCAVRWIAITLTSSYRQCEESATRSAKIREHETSIDSTQANGVVHRRSSCESKHFQCCRILRYEERNREKCGRKPRRTGLGHQRAYGARIKRGANTPARRTEGTRRTARAGGFFASL